MKKTVILAIAILCCAQLFALDWKTYEIADGWEVRYVDEYTSQGQEGRSFYAFSDGLCFNYAVFEQEAVKGETTSGYEDAMLSLSFYGYTPSFVFQDGSGHRSIHICYVHEDGKPRIEAQAVLIVPSQNKSFLSVGSLEFLRPISRQEALDVGKIVPWAISVDGFIYSLCSLIPSSKENLTYVVRSLFQSMMYEAGDWLSED